MRASLFVLVFAAVAACGGRQVEVRTAPAASTSAEQSVRVLNGLSQPVNVYVVQPGGSELFLRQVASNAAETLPVQGVASGANVTFKAVTLDGSRTYQSRSVALTGLYTWSVP